MRRFESSRQLRVHSKQYAEAYNQSLLILLLACCGCDFTLLKPLLLLFNHASSELVVRALVRRRDLPAGAVIPLQLLSADGGLGLTEGAKVTAYHMRSERTLRCLTCRNGTQELRKRTG